MNEYVGIDDDDMEVVIRKSSINKDEVWNKIVSCRSVLSTINKSVNSNDIKFLNQKLNDDISLLGNVLNKLDGYHQLMNGVKNAYQGQARLTTKSLRNFASKLR